MPRPELAFSINATIGIPNRTLDQNTLKAQTVSGAVPIDHPSHATVDDVTY